MPESNAVPEGGKSDPVAPTDSTARPALSIDWSSSSEEPWEAQISSLLSSLPPVEPPPGFLEALAMNGPRISAPFTLDVESPFAFPVIENDTD